MKLCLFIWSHIWTCFTCGYGHQVAKVLRQSDVFALVPNLERVLWNVLTTNIQPRHRRAVICAHDEVAVMPGPPQLFSMPL